LRKRFSTCNVTESLQAAIEEFGKIEIIRTDNGPEFISKTLDRFHFKERIKREFIKENLIRMVTLNHPWINSGMKSKPIPL